MEVTIIHINQHEGILLPDYIAYQTSLLMESEDLTAHVAKSQIINALSDELFTDKQIIRNALNKGEEIYVFDTPDGIHTLKVTNRFRRRDLNKKNRKIVEKRANYLRN